MPPRRKRKAETAAVVHDAPTRLEAECHRRSGTVDDTAYKQIAVAVFNTIDGAIGGDIHLYLCVADYVLNYNDDKWLVSAYVYSHLYLLTPVWFGITPKERKRKAQRMDTRVMAYRHVVADIRRHRFAVCEPCRGVCEREPQWGNARGVMCSGELKAHDTHVCVNDERRFEYTILSQSSYPTTSQVGRDVFELCSGGPAFTTLFTKFASVVTVCDRRSNQNATVNLADGATFLATKNANVSTVAFSGFAMWNTNPNSMRPLLLDGHTMKSKKGIPLALDKVYWQTASDFGVTIAGFQALRYYQQLGTRKRRQLFCQDEHGSMRVLEAMTRVLTPEAIETAIAPHEPTPFDAWFTPNTWACIQRCFNRGYISKRI